MMPSKVSKSQEQKQPFPQYIFNKIDIFQKVQIFREKKEDIFSNSGGSSRDFDYLFICLGLIVKL